MKRTRAYAYCVRSIMSLRDSLLDSGAAAHDENFEVRRVWEDYPEHSKVDWALANISARWNRRAGIARALMQNLSLPVTSDDFLDVLDKIRDSDKRHDLTASEKSLVPPLHNFLLSAYPSCSSNP